VYLDHSLLPTLHLQPRRVDGPTRSRRMILWVGCGRNFTKLRGLARSRWRRTPRPPRTAALPALKIPMRFSPDNLSGFLIRWSRAAAGHRSAQPAETTNASVKNYWPNSKPTLKPPGSDSASWCSRCRRAGQSVVLAKGLRRASWATRPGDSRNGIRGGFDH